MPVQVVLRDPRRNRFPLSPLPSTPRDFNASATIVRQDSRSGASIDSPRFSIRRRTEDIVRRSQEIVSDDISASSRLSGYFYIFTAYCVLLVSSIKEEFNRIDDPTPVENVPQLTNWKMRCVVFGSATYVGLMSAIILMHFDTFACPSLWRAIFKNESKFEGALLSVLVILSTFLVYVSTCTAGLGGFAGGKYNVYFSSWVGCIAACHTLNLWLVESGTTSLGDMLEKHRRTSKNWAGTLLFSFITLASLLDAFTEVDGVRSLTETSILIMLICSSVSCLSCISAILMNVWCGDPQPNCCTLSYIWSRIEGLLLLILGGFWSWVVFELTGINGLANGPSNSYFGVWGSFYFSISTFGVWLKDFRLSR